ncbi:MAG TPA: hypothetical protein EYH17_00765, partial [Pyrodictium sp.]|nr:hypothetical protein [Pyrodictium sp.]
MKNSKSNTSPLELLWIEGMGRWWKDASWSPNGKVLAAAEENSISFLFYLDMDSPHVREAIYYGFSRYLGDLSYYGAIAFAWSPDSKRIALVAEKYGLAEFFVKLFVLELDIDKLIELIKKGEKEDENKCRSFEYEFYIQDEIGKEIFKNFIFTTLSYSKRDVRDLPRFVKPSIAWWPSKNNVIIHHTSSLTLYRLEGTRIAKVWSIDRSKMAKILDLHRDSGFYFTALIPVKNLLYAVGVYYTIPSNAKNTGSTEPLVEPLILVLDSRGDIVNYCDSKCLDLKPLRKPLREEEMLIKDVKLSPNHRYLALIGERAKDNGCKALLVYKIDEKGNIEKGVKKVFEASYAEAVVWFDDRTLGVIDYDGYLSLYTFNAPTLKFIGELKIKP